MGGEKKEGAKRPTTDDDEHPHIDEDAFDPENPGESAAGRGGIVSPGGKLPLPEEDPRKDSGLYEKEPKKK